MTVEPLACQPRHFVQRPGFFEQVCCSRHDHQLLFAAQPRERRPVELNDLCVVSSDNKQRGRPNACQGGTGGRPPRETTAFTTSGRAAAATSAAAAPVLAPK